MADYSLAELLNIANEANFVHPAAKDMPAKVHSAVAKKAASSGRSMIAAQFVVTGGPNAGKGSPIYHNFVLNVDNPRQLDFFFQQMANLGVSPQAIQGGMALEQVAAAIVGKECSIEVRVGEYQGRPKNEIGWVNASKTAPVPTPHVPESPASAPVPAQPYVPPVQEQQASNGSVPAASGAPELPF
jgi:hypothetical protein